MQGAWSVRASRWVPDLDLHSSWTETELFPMGMLILGLGLEPSLAFTFLELKYAAFCSRKEQILILQL